MKPDKGFRTHPDPSEWDNYVDYESTSWPKKDRRRYWIIPSICFNCESACGVLAYVDKETFDVRKIEGNPVHRLTELVHENGVDLLVLGSSYRSALDRLLLGSTAETMLYQAPCDVLLVKPEPVAARFPEQRAA